MSSSYLKPIKTQEVFHGSLKKAYKEIEPKSGSSRLLKKIFEGLGPEVEINEKEKSVYIKEGIFFSHLTEAYYILKGYSIERL
jgi:hypothetical protein